MALSCPDPAKYFPTELGCIPRTPLGFVDSVYGKGLGIIGGVALLFIIWGGYLILTSQGDPIQLRRGRGYVTYSLIGVLLALGGYALYQILAKDVLKIPGF